MKIISTCSENIIACSSCFSEILVEFGDLQWDMKQSCYYVVCPICGYHITLKKSKYWDDIWERQESKKVKQTLYD